MNKCDTCLCRYGCKDKEEFDCKTNEYRNYEEDFTMKKPMTRLTKREGRHTVRIGNEWRRNNEAWLRLADYEDIGLTPDEISNLLKINIE